MADETPDRAGSEIEAQLRTVLDRAAEEIEVEPVPTEHVVRRGRTRRRRRRAALGTVGALAVLAAAGVGVAVLERDDGDSIATSDDTGQTVDEPTVVVDEDASTDPATPAVVVTAPPDTKNPAVTESTTEAPAATDVVAATVPVSGGADQLVPWADGFLAIGLVFPAQPLPSELPEEIRSLFPQEVLDLFPDGLPPTIDEAITILTEADLLDEVTAVLADHPEASDAIYGVPTGGPTISARFTADGAAWTDIELDAPIEGYPNVSRSGDWLLVWSVEEPQYGPSGPLPDPDGARTLTVARTADLESWDVATYDIPVEPSPQPYVQHDVWVPSVALTATGWVANVQEASNVMYDALIPDELMALGERSGYGIGEQTDGILFEYWDESGDHHSQLLTWDELGIEPIELGGMSGPAQSEFVVGDFAGAVETIPTDTMSAYINTMVSTGDQVLALGDGVWTSADGRSWAPLAGLPDDVWVDSAATTATGAILTSQGPGGQQAWLLDATGAVTEIDLPDIGHTYSSWMTGSSGAWIVDASEQQEPDWEPQTVVIEHDGFRVDITNGPEGEQLVATDLATGEVVYEIAQPWDTADRVELYEWNETTGEGGLVLRDADGAKILVVPSDVLDAAWREQQPAPEPAVEEDWAPDLWLLATDDGAEWLVRDLPDDIAQAGPVTAAVSGGNVLYPLGDTWALEPLP